MRKTKLTIIAILFVLFSYGQNQNVSNGLVFDGEPYLAINPNNPQHIVIAWMGWINVIQKFQIKTITSIDGGSTWSSATTLPHTVSGYTSADPCIDFNMNGDVYISYIDFTGTEPPVTGGVYISKSTDGGLNWGSPLEVINTNYDGTKWPIDRPWMVIDKSSGSTQGNIYITTFNLNRTNPAFNPYLSYSSDDGNSFSTKYLDTTNWLAGNLNPFPMCSPAVGSTGTFYGIYPSFVLSQSSNFQLFLVSSEDGGTTLEHKHVLTQTNPASAIDYPNAKKGGLMLTNPSNNDHLAYIFLGADFGDLDIFFMESTNAGTNWSTPIRINDDPISNDRMQDLVWGDFDSDGDLIVSWRDRRNGSDGSYETSSEIWAAYKLNNSSSFSSNFQITDQSVAYDAILESAGNDFMSIKLQDDIINATWGDPRNGDLNIWFQRMTIDGMILSLEEISNQNTITLEVFPNPTNSKIKIIGKGIMKVNLCDIKGYSINTFENISSQEEFELPIDNLQKGSYIVQIYTNRSIVTRKVIKD